MGAGAMNTDTSKYGWTGGAAKYASGGTHHGGIDAFVHRWTWLQRTDVGTSVQHVLRNLDQHGSWPTRLRKRERFRDARTDLADIERTRAKASRCLKNVQLSAQLMPETTLCFDKG